MLLTQEIILRLVVASVFGAFIGWERERKDWAAGLRTHMMVCVGSCLIMIVSEFGFYDILMSEHVSLDPSRVAAQVVSGIGFIGAGSIIFLKSGTIRGLTTAAGLWTVAAIGLATGGGLYIAAAATTLIALIILWVLKPIEERLFKKYRRETLKIITHSDANHTALFNNVFFKDKLSIKSFSIQHTEEGMIFQVTFENMDPLKMEAMIVELEADTTIKEITWTN